MAPVTPPAAAPAGWRAHLRLHYQLDGSGPDARTISFDRHEGPLRVLQRLYPEGPGICHHVVVHPPGGVVGGDELRLDARLDDGTRAVITTPGATRFYRSDGALAVQQATLTLAAGARLEWLPLEAIAHPGCRAVNRVRFSLDRGAQMIGWDLLALGLPASGETFDRGSFEQHLEWPGHWLERGRIDAGDVALLDGPVGLAGHRVLGTAWFATGVALSSTGRDSLLEVARDAIATAAAAALAAALAVKPGAEDRHHNNAVLLAGATSPQPGLVIVRVLAQRIEPALQLLAAVRAAWRLQAWGLAPNPPRVWRT